MTNGKPARKIPKDRIISFRATQDYWDRMGTIQDKTGATPGEQIRRALDKWLKQQEAGR